MATTQEILDQLNAYETQTRLITGDHRTSAAAFRAGRWPYGRINGMRSGKRCVNWVGRKAEI